MRADRGLISTVCTQDPSLNNFESLKVLPYLIRINWGERVASEMGQEYCYLPDWGVEKSRVIHKTTGNHLC
ncbi:MAG TPA: hypothetical protein PLP18_01630 [Smithellaceae bacterium]|nr:hypothetical protein [Smithellaceae bacterium]